MNRDNFDEAIINAETAFSNGNYALALEWFRKALEEKPDDLQALSRAGTVCVPLDKYDESLEYFQKVMVLNPENGDNAFNLGNAYFFHGDYGKSLELYAEAETKGCSDEVKPKLYYQMALLCSIRQDVKSALINFRKYEDTDKTETAALNPDVISEKIKLYMLAEDYDNAAKCAVQWIAVSPAELRSYMVYFSILMAKQEYEKAEQVINDAEKYAVLDEKASFTLKMERVALLSAKADKDSGNAETYLQNAYNLVTELLKDVSASQKNELTLMLAEICMKMKRYEETIKTAISLLPKDKAIEEYKMTYEKVSYEELDEMEIEAMAEEDMQFIDDKIASGEIDESIGEYAEVYYDEDGNSVREYPEGVFDESLYTEENESVEIHEEKPQETVEKPSADYYDRLYFILLSCYAAIEDYKNSYKFGGILKNSENVYYAYFGRYTEAFSMKKLAESFTDFSEESADKKYAEAIAFYRSQMMKNSNNNYAVIFRARMYAETDKFAKAEEMANLLSFDEKEAVMEYISGCRKEYRDMKT